MLLDFFSNYYNNRHTMMLYNVILYHLGMWLAANCSHLRLKTKCKCTSINLRLLSHNGGLMVQLKNLFEFSKYDKVTRSHQLEANGIELFTCKHHVVSAIVLVTCCCHTPQSVFHFWELPWKSWVMSVAGGSDLSVFDLFITSVDWISSIFSLSLFWIFNFMIFWKCQQFV